MLPYFKFHHLGYAVKDIKKTARYYQKAGWILSDITLDPIQNTYIAFLTKEGMPKYELVAPVDDNSPIVKTLGKLGNTPYHVCYSVDDIEKAVVDLKALHFVPLFNPVPAVAIDNEFICYLYNPYVGLIEIVQEK